MYEVLAIFEVAPRNALHRELVRWHRSAGRPREWYHVPAHLLEQRAREDVSTALQRLPLGQPTPPPTMTTKTRRA
jgi:hypothetical protein